MSEVKTESWQEEDEDFPLSSVFTANQLVMLLMFLLFFGTLALILTLALKAALLATLAARFGAGGAALGWLAVESGSRVALVGVWRALPAARPGGLSALCGAPTRRAFVCALVLAGPVYAVCIATYSPAALLLAALGQGLAGYGVARIAMSKIGGQTGDVLGATQQLACLAGLTGLCILV